ncbi:hypothetical protein [Prosthecobacter sp.]|uniref:hypothetical protein n=1 Tax=Prosthecobacter sp. TaxID=1965333 RepID=UPI0024894B84|nr:hypothetical protein [Prosthecobacter sp.]MDI1314962.1 hypothetical protein [Prosthecobacter sp.]
MFSTPEEFDHLPKVDEEAVEKPESGGPTQAEAREPVAPASPPPQRPAADKNKATKKIPLTAHAGGSPPKQQSHPASVFKPRPAIRSRMQPDAEAPPAHSWRQRWDKWGGRSLALSFAVHALIWGAGAVIVVHQVIDKQIDFISGGGSVQGAQAAEALQHKIQQKKNPWLKKAMPNRKLAVADSLKDVMVLTDVPDMLDLPQTVKPMGAGAFSGGFGLAGAAGGSGNGVGLGAKSGMVFGPLFGLTIKAKKLAVVLDVSSSMMPHLERVVNEVDKVAKGSVVVLYFGCGLEAPSKPLVGTKIFRTSTVEFGKFWRLGGATFMETAQYKIDTRKPIPIKDLFLKLSRRPQTYFIHNVGVGYTWLALLSDEVRNADGLYWFSDFQDVVDFKQLSVVLDNLKRRKQRLYIHSSGKGEYFDLVKNQLVVPTEGDSYIDE